LQIIRKYGFLRISRNNKPTPEQTMRTFKPLYFITFSILLGACNSNGSDILQISGDYTGTLITHSGLSLQTKQVSLHIPSPQAGSKGVTLTDASGASILQLAFTNQNKFGFTLVSSEALSSEVPLKFDPSTTCYLDATLEAVKLCVTAPEITFEINDAQGSELLSLILYPTSSVNPVQVEPPQTFTLSQAIERAQKMSFQSKIEFEYVLQARATAAAAYQHLLPQLTFSTVVNNLTPSVSSLLSAIGDLAPFLFPSRWIQAKEAKAQSQAEQDSERLMRLDTAAKIEGLFYTYDQDKRSLAVYKAFDARLMPLLASIRKGEEAGQLLVGSTDTLQAAYNDITHNEDVYGRILTEDRSALAQAMGFYNPLAVQDTQIDGEEFPIENAPTVDFNTINAAALARSVEVDQLNYLIENAKLVKREEHYDWLDPDANPQLGLGIALQSQLSVAQSQIDKLNIVREQMQSGISHNTLNAVTDYNQALDNFQDSQSDTVLHEQRLSETLDQFNSGAHIDIFDLCSVIGDDLGANLALEQGRADYRVARAEINRLQLQGYYQGF
jgi:hypothetical protein